MAAVLGALQGTVEWLPPSSEGFVAVVDYLTVDTLTRLVCRV